jgi:hypothetical protein
MLNALLATLLDALLIAMLTLDALLGELMDALLDESLPASLLDALPVAMLTLDALLGALLDALLDESLPVTLSRTKAVTGVRMYQFCMAKATTALNVISAVPLYENTKPTDGPNNTMLIGLERI